MAQVECHLCGYEWNYSGNMRMATCPSCGRKTPVSEDDDDE